MGCDDPDLLAGIRHFREAGIGVLPEGKLSTDHSLKNIMSGPSSAETKQTEKRHKDYKVEYRSICLIKLNIFVDFLGYMFYII